MKKGVFILIILMFSILVFAQEEFDSGSDTVIFDESASVEWLRNKTAGPLSVEELSYSILALGDTALVARLNEQRSEEGCWPKESCTPKDTALAVYALYSMGGDYSKSVEWLKSNKRPWRGGGKWLVQIEASDLGGAGKCDVSYKVGDVQSGVVPFTVEGNEVGRGGSVVRGNYFINVERDLGGGVLNSPSSKISINCAELAANPIISLIYKEGNNIYILEDQVSSIVDFTVANACYGRGGCSYEDSVFVSWVLKEIGDVDELGTDVYLEVGLTNNALHRAVLSRFLQKRVYLDAIVADQDANGRWGGSVFTTAFTVFSLSRASEYSEARVSGEEFLKRVVRGDGSWNQVVKDTAMSLVALRGVRRGVVGPGLDVGDGGGVELICDDGIDDDSDGLVDCGDGDCEMALICAGEDFGDEFVIEDCNNGIDDDSDGLADCDDDDCYLECADSDVDYGFDGDDEGLGDLDEKSYAWIIWVIVVLVLVGGGVFFYLNYVKTGKVNLFKPKRPKGPTFSEFRKRMEIRPKMPSKAVKRPAVRRVGGKPVRSKGEEELDKSLREAEKLLKSGK